MFRKRYPHFLEILQRKKTRKLTRARRDPARARDETAQDSRPVVEESHALRPNTKTTKEDLDSSREGVKVTDRSAATPQFPTSRTTDPVVSQQHPPATRDPNAAQAASTSSSINPTSLELATPVIPTPTVTIHTATVVAKYATRMEYPLIPPEDVDEARKLLDFLEDNLNVTYHVSLEDCVNATCFLALIEDQLIKRVAIYVANGWEPVPHSTGQEINAMFKRLRAKVQQHDAIDTTNQGLVKRNFAAALAQCPLNVKTVGTFEQQANSLMKMIAYCLTEAHLLQPVIDDYEKNNKKGGTALNKLVWDLILHQIPHFFEFWIRNRAEVRAMKQGTKFQDFQSPIVILEFLMDPRGDPMPSIEQMASTRNRVDYHVNLPQDTPSS